MKSSRQPYISKSTYLMGLQCQKLIWFRYNAKDQIPASDEATQAIFDQGTEVGGLPKLEHRQFDAALAAGMNFGMIRFMRKFSIFVLALVCSFNSFARESTLLDSGWRFMQGDPAGVAGQAMSPADPNWIDSSWQAVSIPHNWGWAEAQVGKDYYRGPGWYRRELAVTPEPGKRYFLRFEAASLVADVYLNGKLLGEHRGGFGAFCFEITTNLSASGMNLLAVRVSNKSEPDIAPLSGDFSVYGGLYRPVHLLVTGEENFTPTDHGSPGVAWLQTKVTKNEATIDVTAQISNGTRKDQWQTLVATVLDAKGNPVASREEKIMLAPNVTAPYWLRVTVPHPHLWNGRKDPYLYRAVVELRATNGIVDSVEQPLGLRFYSVDPDKGFFLNGQPYDLHGVDKHQDRFNKGWAVSEADLDEDISLIKEIGATVVRCAHYQHSDYFYSLCDQAGILVWAEIPQVNEINPSEQFEETSRNQLLDLIRQNINHPSIFVWSLFNEIARRHAGPAPRVAGFEHRRPRRRPDASDHCGDVHCQSAGDEQDSRPARLEHLSGLVFGLGNKG